MNYNIEKVRHISHEIKNQLSICDLYTEILERYCDKNGIKDETIIKSISCIKYSVQIANNTLLELKSSDNQELGEYSLAEIVNESYELSKVYGESKGINISVDMKDCCIVTVDKNRFMAVIINIVKNACEAFKNENNKHIKIFAETENSIARIIVSNNAQPIVNSEIFDEGITTKESGSGFGLYISRKNMEEMGGTLRLLKSDENSTEFEIMVRVVR